MSNKVLKTAIMHRLNFFHVQFKLQIRQHFYEKKLSSSNFHLRDFIFFSFLGWQSLYITYYESIIFIFLNVNI